MTSEPGQNLTMPLLVYASLIIAGSDMEHGTPGRLPVVLAAKNVRAWS